MSERGGSDGAQVAPPLNPDNFTTEAEAKFREFYARGAVPYPYFRITKLCDRARMLQVREEVSRRVCSSLQHHTLMAVIHPRFRRFRLHTSLFLFLV